MKKRKLLLAILLIFTINFASFSGVQLPTKVIADTTMSLNQNSKKTTKKIRKLKKRAKKWDTYRSKKQKVILKVRPVQKNYIYDSWATNINNYKFKVKVTDAYLYNRWICFDIEGSIDLSEEGYESPEWDSWGIDYADFYVYYGYMISNSKGKVVNKLIYKENLKYMRNYEIGCLGLGCCGLCSEDFSESVDTMCRVPRGKKWRTFYIEPIIYFIDDEEYGAIWEFL